MDDKLKREIQEMARKKRDEVIELNRKRKDLMKELEDAQKESDVRRFIEAKNARALTEEEVDRLVALKKSGMFSSWSLPSVLPAAYKLVPFRSDETPETLFGYSIETEDETIYPFSDYSLDHFGDLFGDSEWFGCKFNRTILALLNDRFVVWNADHLHTHDHRKFLNVPDFVDRILGIRLGDIRWIQSYSFIEHHKVWYRGTISWKIDGVEGSKSIVFRQLHEDIWNYLAAYSLDPNDLDFFDLRLDTYDPTAPLNEYEVSKIYEVGIETLETSHKSFSMSAKITDDRKKTFKSFSDGGLFHAVYEDDSEK